MNYMLLAVLVLGHCAVDLNQGSLPALLPILKEQLGLNYAQTASILTVMTFASSIIQPVFGYLSDRWKMLWIMPAGVLVAGLAYACLSFVNNYWQILVMVFISGLGVAAFHPEGAKEALLNSSKRVVSMSWFMLGGNIGYGLGPLAIFACYALAGQTGLTLFAIPALVVTVLLCRVLFRKDKSKRPVSAVRVAPQPIGARYKPMLLLLTSVLFRSSVQFAMIVFLPFYIIKQWGWSEMDTNPVLAFYLITGSIGTILGGHIAQRIGPRRFFLISVVLVSPLTILFITAPYGLWFYIWLGLSSMALMATWSSMLVMGQDIMPDRSAMAAALMVGFSIGSGGLCATLMGVIADHWGVLSVIWITAFLPLVSAFLGYWVPESDKKPTLMTIETKVAP